MRNVSTLLPVFAFLCLATTVHAQGFLRSFPLEEGGADFSNVMGTSDGGVLYRYARHPQKPMVRFDANGTIAWSKAYGNFAYFPALAPLPGGGAIVVSDVDFSPGVPDSM